MTSLGPQTAFIGWDVRGGTADQSAAKTFARSDTDDLVAKAHYELIAVAARGFRPPKFLSMLETLEGEPESDVSYAGLRQTWSLRYRQVAETAPSEVIPYAIYLLGVNPPPELSDAELQVFNDFYTNVHLPEVAERRHALRAVRYELLREVRPPYQGAPKFLAIYEVDEKAASNRRHVGPAYATGPEVWQRHTTPWRLWYRRLIT